MLAEQRPQREILSLSRYSRVTAYHLLGRYREQGLAALQDGRQSNRGAPTLLTPAEQQRLAAQLHDDFERGIVWEGKQLQTWIQQEFGKDVYLGRTYEFMRAAGFSPQKPCPQHVKSDEEAKEVFRTKG
ncbi:winged helix-turn-helix domain-containing protein [Deinococcus radiopugnans]|uniref:winged helix-turn-helix domain-containing protein n=1 Tax=Deinococcus radiopugnans TaxID=57497 RepID=UPI0036111DE9